MEKGSKSHVILGAGPLGYALAQQLQAADTPVRLFSFMGNQAYDMPGTQPQTLDGRNTAAVTAACANAAVIYLLLNAHYVDWYELYPPRLEAALEAAAESGVKLIYHDNIYMYGPSKIAYTEETPYAATTRKGQLRGDMARRLLDAHHAGKVRAVIGRSADMYGPGALNSSFNSTLGERHFYPMLAGKTVNILGNINLPHTYAYVGDVAAALITLAAHDEALGEVWHLPAAPTLSHRELITKAFVAAGQSPKVRGSIISGYFVRMIGLFQPDVRELAETLYQFEQPLVVDHSKFAQAFGAQPTPHEEALQQTLAWYKAN